MAQASAGAIVLPIMQTIFIPSTNETFLLPENIYEFTGDQWPILVKLYLLLDTKAITYDEFKNGLITQLLGIKKTYAYEKLTPDLAKLKIHENMSSIEDMIDTLFEVVDDTGKETRHISILSSKQYYPFIKVGRKKLYGPGDAMNDATWYEYRTACYLYEQFLNSKEEKDLNMLFAFLYRPGKWPYFIRKRQKSYNGIRRSEITSTTNPVYLENRAKLVSNLPFELRYSAIIYIAGTLDYLRNGEPEINGRPLKLEKLYDDDKVNDESIGLTGLLYTMAETGIFGDINQVDAQNLYMILARMYQVVLYVEEQKRENKPKNKDE